MTLRFTIPGPPVGKGRPRKGKNGRMYTPKRTREYEKHVRGCGHVALMASRGVLVQKSPSVSVATLLDGCRYLDLKIYHRDKRRRDADNIVKAIMDGLTGVLWEDDADVWPRVQYVERGSELTANDHSEDLR